MQPLPPHSRHSMASAPSREKSVGQGEAEVFWGPLGALPSPLHPMLPHLPCACPALPCYSLLQPPPLGLFPQPVSGPCELPGGPPLLWPAPLLYSPLLRRPGTPEDPSRGKAAASRESTAALKAWLGQHPKNPYPSKGEKVLLAIVSRMSLTQVSTWFANARRRLKKENRAGWAPRTPKAEGEDEDDEEGGGGGEGEASGEGAAAAAAGTPPPRTALPQRGSSPAERAAPWRRAGQWPGLPASPPPAPAEGQEVPAKPTIWRVAELATRTQPGRGAL